MLFCPNVFLYAAILLVAFVSMLFVGAGCMKLLPELYFRNNPLTNVFVCLMSGNIVLVTVFAIFCARFNTIMLLAVALIAGYLLFFRQKSENTSQSVLFDITFVKYSSFAVILLLLIYLISYYVFFVRANGEIWCDYPFYSNVSCHMVKNHCENTDLYSDMRNAGFYHWGDLWLVSLFGSLFDVNYLYVLLLVVYPCLTLICVLGGAAAVNKMIKSVFLSFVSGISLLFAIPIMAMVIRWYSPVVIGSKIILVYCFVILSLVFYGSGRAKLSFISLLLLVPFYSPVAVGVLTMVCTLSVLEMRKDHSSILNRICNPAVLLSVFVSVFYVLFYFVQDNNAEMNSELLYGNFWTGFFGFSIKRSCRIMVLFPAMFAMLIVLKNNVEEKNKSVFWFLSVIVGVIMSSVVGGALKQIMLDGGQVTTNFTGPVVIITCWYAAIVLLSRFQDGKFIKLGVPLLFVFYLLSFILSPRPQIFMKSDYNYSSEEERDLENLKFELRNSDCSFGYYRNYQREENFNTQKSRIRMCYPMDKMPHLLRNGYYAPYCLSALDIPDDLEPRWNEKKQSQLYKFKEQQNADGMFVNEELLIRKFISEKNIKFIVIENGCDMPDYLQGHVVNVYNGKDKVYKICN